MSMKNKSKSEHDASKPFFSWNDIGNRFLWLGYLLSRLDTSYEDADAIFLQPDNEAHKNEIAEIIDWQNKLISAMGSGYRQARMLNSFFNKHSMAPMMDGMKYRIIAVVCYRQTLMHFMDIFGIHIARMSSLQRTIDDIMQHRNVAVGLVQVGILVPKTFVGRHYLGLHEGLGKFLLGDEPTPADKPVTTKPPDPAAPPPVPAPSPSPENPTPAAPGKPEKPNANPVSLPDFIKSLPEMTPMEMAALIKKEGYIGQEKAVKSVCLLAWRHLNRLKKIFVEKADCNELPAKGNSLLLGPTGSGKTYLIELLFSKIIKLPVVISDATIFTETGYVGAEVSNIFTRLIQVAGNDVEKAGVGIICLDEFDKLAGTGSAVRFSGEGTTKDLKMGVQQELLKLMEASEVNVPMELSHASSVKKSVMNTRNVPFICCGAFSGFWKLLKNRGHSAIGFGAVDGKNTRTDFKDEVKRASSFESYGILPELFGRFSSVTVFDALNVRELKMILELNTVRQYDRELALNGLTLQVCPDVYDNIVEQCLERQTGARGLQTALISHLEDALFEAYSTPGSRGVRLFITAGQIGWEVTKRHLKRDVKTNPHIEGDKKESQSDTV